MGPKNELSNFLQLVSKKTVRLAVALKRYKNDPSNQD